MPTELDNNGLFDQLTAETKDVLKALQKLVKNYAPDPHSGGFSPDDVSMHCQHHPEAIEAVLHTLADKGIVKAVDSDGNPWDTHFTLPV